jgi:hypothetical protein
MVSKNQRPGMRGRQDMNEETVFPCLRKYNYGNGAGWRSKNKKNIQWNIRRLGEGRRKYTV